MSVPGRKTHRNHSVRMLFSSQGEIKPGRCDPGLSRMVQPRTSISYAARLGGVQKMVLPGFNVLYHLCAKDALIRLCRVP